MILGHYISIVITGNDKKQALELLKDTVKQIEEGVTDCSSHDDTYMPYQWWTSYNETEEKNRVAALWNEKNERKEFIFKERSIKWQYT